jgi:A/G-specific adenine glycosylase
MMVMPLTKTRINTFHEMIFVWWKDHRRSLPWRETNDPYRILVSEVMLQQTQVSRALPKYEEFLYFFPDVYALASAKTSQVLKVWQGMGYNRRALYLKKTAEAVVSAHHGYFPEAEMDLLKLPGVGKYTARAIMVFAFRQDVAMIDTNIRQILVHFFFDGKAVSEKEVENVADALVPKGKSWEWHQALMDYGALALKAVRGKTKAVMKAKAVPFKESDRYFRGRIVDALRQKDWKEKELVSYMSAFYKKPSMFITRIVDGLVKDSLVTRKKNVVQLPD